MPTRQNLCTISSGIPSSSWNIRFDKMCPYLEQPASSIHTASKSETIHAPSQSATATANHATKHHHQHRHGQKILHRQLVRCVGAHPLFSILSWRGLNPIKLAYSPSPPDNGWVSMSAVLVQSLLLCRTRRQTQTAVINMDWLLPAHCTMQGKWCSSNSQDHRASRPLSL